MASTAHTDKELVEEHYDPHDVLAQKVDALADMVRNSKHFVAFTGAGISTSAGIPDFRGPTGKWTRQAQGLEPVKGVSVVDAYPTATHMALVELHKRGVLKYLISQNCDGLHRRSGFPASAISELHGNCWVEICEDCGQQYFRDFRCSRRTKPGGAKNPTDHFTGRFCSCGGRLLNSTIDFGQGLPSEPLRKAQQHSFEADLHLACGSSLCVRPACDHPLMTASKGGKLVICNLQKTPLTDQAAMQIYAHTDTVMTMLMERLNVPIPPFLLLRRIVVGKSEVPQQIYAKAVDIHDPTRLMGQISAVDWDGRGAARDALRDPMAAIARHQGFHQHRTSSSLNALNPKFHFAGHYHEPPVNVSIDLSRSLAVDISLAFDPNSGEWALLSQFEIPDGKIQAPADCVDALVPDYGQSHRKYCIEMLMDSQKCDQRTAAEKIKKRFDASREEALKA